MTVNVGSAPRPAAQTGPRRLRIEWRHRHHPLSRDTQPDPARREHGQAGTGGKELGNQGCDGIEKMFEIVEHQEQLPLCQERLDSLKSSGPRPSGLQGSGQSRAAPDPDRGPAQAGRRRCHRRTDRERSATCKASRVLPMPPGPVSVSRRTSGRSGGRRRLRALGPGQ